MSIRLPAEEGGEKNKKIDFVTGTNDDAPPSPVTKNFTVTATRKLILKIFCWENAIEIDVYGDRHRLSSRCGGDKKILQRWPESDFAVMVTMTRT